MGSGVRGMRRGESGQMAVELAVMLPVVLAILVVAIDCLVYVGECARFDHLAPQRVLELAVSPGRDAPDEAARVEAVRSALAAEFDGHGETVEVSCSDAGAVLSGARDYELRLSMPPWPLEGRGLSVFGVRVPTRLSHTCHLVVDPYQPGALP